MRIISNEELLAVAGSGCEAVVASTTQCAESGGKNILACGKMVVDVFSCAGLVAGGTVAINSTVSFFSEMRKSGDPMIGLLNSNQNLDSYDAPNSYGGGNSGGSGQSFMHLVEVDEE